MSKEKLCGDCDAKVGELHSIGCDIERCPVCGLQAISCGCPEDEKSKYPKLPWTGEYPGESECREFGWYAKLDEKKGWIPCEKDEPGANIDLNRLYTEATWDPAIRKFVKVKSS